MKAWNDIFNAPKVTPNQKLLYTVKLSFNFDEKLKIARQAQTKAVNDYNANSTEDIQRNTIYGERKSQSLE